MNISIHHGFEGIDADASRHDGVDNFAKHQLS